MPAQVSHLFFFSFFLFFFSSSVIHRLYRWKRPIKSPSSPCQHRTILQQTFVMVLFILLQTTRFLPLPQGQQPAKFILLTGRKASPHFPQPLSSLFMYVVYAARVAPKPPPWAPTTWIGITFLQAVPLLVLSPVCAILLIPTLRYKNDIAGSVVQEKNYFLHSSVRCLLKHNPNCKES